MILNEMESLKEKIKVGLSILIITGFLIIFILIIVRITSKDVYPSGMDNYYDAMGNQPGIPTYMNKTP